MMNLDAGPPPKTSRRRGVAVAQTQTAGYSLRARPRRNCVGEDLLAEFAMTKPEITKNISTPTQPNHVKGAADGYSTSAATERSKPGTPNEHQAQDQNVWSKMATPRAVPH